MTDTVLQITGKTRVVGVWGHPVGHSRSPGMHNAAFRALGLNWVYVAFDVDPLNAKAAVEGIRALGLVGVNVTVPLKESVIPYLDWVDPDAARVASVNTIHNIDGKLHGYSTDGPGFLGALNAIGESAVSRDVLLLGAGGSARAVAYALAGQGAHVTITNRTLDRAQELADITNEAFPDSTHVIEWSGVASRDYSLIVNATSLGMAPRESECPDLPIGMPHAGQCVYDLIYAPPETELLRRARLAGARTENGLKMLAYQGAVSLSIWSGRPLSEIPVDLMEAAANLNPTP